MVFSCNVLNVISLKCVSMNNQECRIRPEIINVNSNEPNKQRWKKDKCRCECKELIDKVICDKGFILNPSNCDCECDKLCDAGEYLDYKNCKCRNKLVDKLVEKCSEYIDGNEMIYNETLNDYKNVYNSCTINIVLFAIVFFCFVFLIIFGISSAFIYLFSLSLKKG